MKQFAIIVLAASLSLPAFAMPMSGDRMVEKLTKKLDLTEEQQQQVKTIFDNKKPEMEALWKQMEALKQSTSTEIKSVLTPEQASEFEAMEEKREERRKHFMEKHRNH